MAQGEPREAKTTRGAPVKPHTLTYRNVKTQTAGNWGPLEAKQDVEKGSTDSVVCTSDSTLSQNPMLQSRRSAPEKPSQAQEDTVNLLQALPAQRSDTSRYLMTCNPRFWDLPRILVSHARFSARVVHTSLSAGKRKRQKDLHLDTTWLRIRVCIINTVFRSPTTHANLNRRVITHCACS